MGARLEASTPQREAPDIAVALTRPSPLHHTHPTSPRIGHPPFVICHPPFAIRHLPSAHLPSAVCHLPFAIRRLPSAICHLLFAICYLPSAICHLPFAICYLPSAISPSPFPTEDRHAVFGTGVRARTICMLALLRVRGIHLTRQRLGQVCHFCHKQWITSRHTGTSGE